MTRTRVVVISEIPVSYRHGWFEHLRGRSSLDLHVVYLAAGQSDRPWESGVSGDWITLQRSVDLRAVGGHIPRLSAGLGRTLGTLDPDVVVVPGWAHPACWQAAAWCKRRRRPYAVMNETWKPQGQSKLPMQVTTGARDTLLRGAALGLPAGSRADGYLASIGMRRRCVVHANTCDSVGIGERTADVERSPDPSVLYVGRLFEHKGAGLLADLARGLAAANVDLVVAGDGPLRREVERLADEAPNVRYLGPLSPAEAHEQMARAWAVVVPSSKEPWGVVVHEALAAGTPVVATSQVGSAADLIGGDTVGSIVEPTPDALVRACVRMLETEPDASACRAAALAISYATAASEFESAVRKIVTAR